MIDSPLPIGGASAPDAAAEESRAVRDQAITLAREFESMLMLQMIRQMRQSLLDEDEKVDGFGNDTFTDTIDGELTRALSASGGIGLATWLAKSLDASGAAKPAASSAASVSGLTSSPADPSTALAGLMSAARARGRAVERADADGVTGIAPEPASALAPVPAEELGSSGVGEGPALMPGAVTSSFGRRLDPFHGRARMHTGVDIRAAYGQSVPSAAEGEVVFAGERGGYGQLVVLRHADGVETRYAHLSAIDVAVGQHVQAGEPLGRIGRSGRATGPHLHFEVLDEGRHVDPLTWAQDSGRLKPAEGVVDLPFDWSPRPVAVNGVEHED